MSGLVGPRDQKPAPTLEPLPSSQLRELRGMVFNKELGYWMRPIFCASCGKPSGYVRFDSTFAFSMCDSPCWEQFGHKTEFMGIPDAIMRRRMEQEKLAEAKTRGE